MGVCNLCRKAKHPSFVDLYLPQTVLSNESSRLCRHSCLHFVLFLVFFVESNNVCVCVHRDIICAAFPDASWAVCVCFSNCSETQVRLMFHMHSWERRAARDQGPWGRDGAEVVLALSLVWLAGFPAVWHTLRSHAALTHAVCVLKLCCLSRAGSRHTPSRLLRSDSGWIRVSPPLVDCHSPSR